MGDWSSQPWGNDEAADWFHSFWKSGDMRTAIDLVEHFDPSSERYDSIRAACHVIIAFSSPYCWPEKYLDQREHVIKKSIDILENMINPPNDSWSFLEIWERNIDVVESVKQQIYQLKNVLYLKE